MNSQVKNLIVKSLSGFFVFVLFLGTLTSNLPAQRTSDDDTEDKGSKVDDTIPVQFTWKKWTSYSCKSLKSSSDSAFDHITTDNELKLNYTPSTSSTTFTFTDNESPSRTLVGPPDTTRTITTQRSSNSLNWSSQKAISAVIIGASSGNYGQVYWYPSGAFSDSNLKNYSNSTITSVNFCYYQPAKVTIIKEASPYTGTGASTTSFPFSSTNLTSPSSFALVDNNSQPADRKIVGDLYKFAKLGSSNWITVTEGLVSGWTLADIECSDNDTVFGQTQYANVIDFTDRKATIKLEEGEEVTCTFRNTQLQPSAGEGSVSGRITDFNGRGIGGANLILTNPSTNAVWIVRTNQFGYYRFDGLEVAELYFLSVKHRRYTFAPDTLTFNLIGDLDGQNFTAFPQ